MKFFRRRRSERGAALIVIALSLIATISVGGVIVDGSNAYAQRRQMQNVADAAALAGARALDQYQAGTLTSGTVSSLAWSRAQSNGVTDQSLFSCDIVDETGATLGACTSSALNSASAAGVHVTVAQTSDTTFMRVAGIKTFTARADATGQIEALRSGPAPFMICAVATTDFRSLGDGQTIGILDSQNNINPAAIYSAATNGPIFQMQDSHAPHCGQGNSFKDLTDGSSHPVPGMWPVPTGDLGNNVTQSIISGPDACAATFDNCIVAVPLCHAPLTVNLVPIANSGNLYCVRYGAFLLQATGNSSSISGKLLGDIVATGGRGGGRAQLGEVRVIKLSS